MPVDAQSPETVRDLDSLRRLEQVRGRVRALSQKMAEQWVAGDNPSARGYIKEGSFLPTNRAIPSALLPAINENVHQAVIRGFADYYAGLLEPLGEAIAKSNATQANEAARTIAEKVIRVEPASAPLLSLINEGHRRSKGISEDLLSTQSPFAVRDFLIPEQADKPVDVRLGERIPNETAITQIKEALAYQLTP